MDIRSIATFPLRGHQPDGQTYWGAATWGGEPRGATYPHPSRTSFVYASGIETVLVRLETESGWVGWGESKAPVGCLATAELIDALLAPAIEGMSILDREVVWERMSNAMAVRGHDAGFWTEALSGIDIAMWDALGRALDQPIATMLGGIFWPEITCYASGVPVAAYANQMGGLERVRDHVELLRADGWSAMKLAIGSSPTFDLAAIATARDALGDDGRLFVDAAGAYDKLQAIEICDRLTDYGVEFFEMPVPPDQLDVYAELAARSKVPLALDSLHTASRARDFLVRSALGVVQPDVCRAGGITGSRRISELADRFGVRATPHVSIGSAVHFAASLQLAAATPNLATMEHWVGTNPLGATIAPDLHDPIAGQRSIGSEAGLGITIDEAAVRSLSIGTLQAEG